MPAAFAELQGDFLYMLTTPSREEIEQMIEDFGQKLNFVSVKSSSVDSEVLLSYFIFREFLDF